MSSSPIRLGFIGLSASNPTAWANRAHLPYLQAQTNKYEIVAISNSSVSSALAAIKHHNLSPNTKAYGSPAELAADPNVDMVVVSVKVAQHYELLKPALLLGKQVFVEWPIGKSLAEAEEITALAKQNGSKGVVGLQGKYAPFVSRLKALLEEGRIGKLISTSVSIEVGAAFLKSVPEAYKYIADASVGGNIFTIVLGHFIHSFTDVVGHFKHLNAQLENKFPTIDVVASFTDPTVIEAGMKKDTEDHFNIHGTLESDAVAALCVRVGAEFPGTAPLTWKLFGEKGQILVTCPSASFQIDYSSAVIKVLDSATDNVESIDLSVNESLETIDIVARNVGRAYEAFADGKGYVSFEEALINHRVLDAFQRSSNTGERVSYKREI